MRRLYRVFPWIRGARAGQPGHPLTVLLASQGRGRIDNPDRYSAFYASGSAAGACAEAFGRLARWTEAMLPNGETGVRAVATIVLTDDRVLDLDEPKTLLDRGLKPSRVVTVERRITQAWALRIFDESAWSGVSWWSYWDPRWTTFGIWHAEAVRVARVEPLTMQSRALREAAEVLNRIV